MGNNFCTGANRQLALASDQLNDRTAGIKPACAHHSFTILPEVWYHDIELLRINPGPGGTPPDGFAKASEGRLARWRMRAWCGWRNCTPAPKSRRWIRIFGSTEKTVARRSRRSSHRTFERTRTGSTETIAADRRGVASRVAPTGVPAPSQSEAGGDFAARARAPTAA